MVHSYSQFREFLIDTIKKCESLKSDIDKMQYSLHENDNFIGHRLKDAIENLQAIRDSINADVENKRLNIVDLFPRD